MRIHPIRAGREVCCFPLCDVPRFIACCPAFRGPCPLEPDCNHFGRHFGERRCVNERRCVEDRGCCHENINEILLQRACAGLLSRMRTFDWQVLHGHYVGGNDGCGTHLDALA